MSYLRGGRYHGVGAIAAEVEATPPSTAPMPRSRSTGVTASDLMLAVPQPVIEGSPTMITPGVQVVRMAPTPDNIIVRVQRATSTVDTLREQALFNGTPAAPVRSSVTSPDLQIGTGIGTPSTRPIAQPDPVVVAPPVPVQPIPAPIVVRSSPQPAPTNSPVRATPPIYVNGNGQVVTLVDPSTGAPVVAPSATSSKLPWIIGGGLLAYLLLK